MIDIQLQKERMPARVFQPDLDQIKTGEWHYCLSWDRANRTWGTFRVSPLRNNVGQGPRQVMNILKAAYQQTLTCEGVTFRSFQDALKFAEEVGVTVTRERYFHGTFEIKRLRNGRWV